MPGEQLRVEIDCVSVCSGGRRSIWGRGPSFSSRIARGDGDAHKGQTPTPTALAFLPCVRRDPPAFCWQNPISKIICFKSARLARACTCSALCPCADRRQARGPRTAQDYSGALMSPITAENCRQSRSNTQLPSVATAPSSSNCCFFSTQKNIFELVPDKDALLWREGFPAPQ